MTRRGWGYTADLLPDGTIGWRGHEFLDPSDFSLAVYRDVDRRCSRQHVDGWKLVRYAGKPLESYRGAFENRKRKSAPAARPDEDVKFRRIEDDAHSVPSSMIDHPSSREESEDTHDDLLPTEILDIEEDNQPEVQSAGQAQSEEAQVLFYMIAATLAFWSGRCQSRRAL